MSTVKLIGLTGSLRSGSFTAALLNTLKQAQGSDVELEVFSLADVPLYNQDLDTEVPLPAVKALRDAISGADGLVIVTPEFNYGLPGVLKNALDWASRPYGAAPLMGKPVVTMSASAAFTGGVRAQAQLNEVLLATQTKLLVRPQVVIGEVHTKVSDGVFTDAVSLKYALAAVEDLVASVRG